MTRPVHLLALVVLGIAAACGQSEQASPAPAAVPAPASSAAPSAPPVAGDAPPAPDLQPVAGQLAVALEGDVRHLGDTRYTAVGPELRCSAMLLPDDGGPAQPATSLVDWKVEPPGAGTFSIGAQGAYFLPSASGIVTIHAELPGGPAPRRSPSLSLSVTSPGPAPAG